MVTRARLRRRTEHRLVAGVAGGIADRLNAPVGFVRVFMFLAAWVAPWVLWAYAGATLVIPPSGRDRPDWDNAVGLARLALVAFGPAVVFLGAFSLDEPFGGPAGWWIAYFGLTAAGALALLGADYWRGHARTRAEARGAVVAAVPVVTCGAALAAAMLLAPDVRWERWLPAIAVVGAATLALGTWRGRIEGLVAPAIVALALTGLVIAGDARLQGGLGDTRVTPTAQTRDPITARRAIGDLSLDLRRATNAGRPLTVEASVGLGTLSVRVPEGARVDVEARVGKGTYEPWLSHDWEVLQGFDQDIRRTYLPRRRARATGVPRIHLTADVGLGTIRIGRDSSVLDDPS